MGLFVREFLGLVKWGKEIFLKCNNILWFLVLNYRKKYKGENELDKSSSIYFFVF